MAVGNTFGATALSSYGGFWIGTAIVLTPGGFEIESLMGSQFTDAFGIYLMVSFSEVPKNKRRADRHEQERCRLTRAILFDNRAGSSSPSSCSS